MELRDQHNITWSDDLPRFDNVAQMEVLRQNLVAGGFEALVLDPCYLAMPGTDAANLFIVGEMLRNVSDLCRQAGVTPILIHHISRGKASYDVPELSDAAWAGFPEFAAQWMLIGRREKYQPGTGEHKLWVSIGGRLGHTELAAVNINEGLRTDPEGRKWEVSVEDGTDARRSTSEQRQQERTARNEQRHATDVQRKREQILQTFVHFPDGTTDREIRGRVGRGVIFQEAWLACCNAGEIVECQVTRENGQTYPGFRRVFRNGQEG